MPNIPCLSPSSLYSIVLTAFLLVAPVVLALPPLASSVFHYSPTLFSPNNFYLSEQRRRAPGLTTMVALSPLVIVGFTLLAVLTSFIVLHLFRFFKARFLSVTQVSLPQPVSAGRTSSLPHFSILSFLRPRPRLAHSNTITAKPTLTRSHWHPLSYIYRRLVRPLSSFHPSGAELLPTTAPDSPSINDNSLIDLPTISRSSTPISKGWSQRVKQTQQPLRSLSAENLPSYRPLTPVPVLIPLSAYTVPAPPSTPPPPTPTSTPGMTSADIPLVPVTPPKRQYTAATMMASGGLLTPPLGNTFPAVSLSPFNSNYSITPTPSSRVVGSRPGSPSPQLFLSSRTLSSLSLSPPSLYMQQQRRSKSLGGVVVKKVSHPHFDLDEFQPERTPDVADSIENVLNNHSQTLVMPPLKDEEGERGASGKLKLVPPTARPPKFLLNFSSSSSSSASDSSLSPDLLSPSPLKSNADSTPTSPPLQTLRMTSYSSDIAKPTEHAPLLPHSIPLVDVDMNVETDMMPGLGINDKTAGWNFDMEEQGNVGPQVENVLVDFDSPVAVSLPSYMKAPLVNLTPTEGKDDRLIGIEVVGTEVDAERLPKGEWGWDNDFDAHGSWDRYPKNGGVVTSHSGWDLEGGEIVSEDEDEDDSVAPLSPSPGTSTPLKEFSTVPVMEVEHPDPDLLPLPETIDVLPSVVENIAEPPLISVCTQDVILCRKESDHDLDITLVSSTGRRTPISPGQIPTPPASPPRETRTASLPKANKDSNRPSPNQQPVDLSVEQDSIIVDAGYAFEEKVIYELPSVEQVEESISSLTNGIETQVSVETFEESEGLDEEMKKFLDRPLVTSPAAMSIVLEEEEEEDGDDQFTFDVESADEDVQSGSDSESQIEVSVVPPSPYAEVVNWGESDDEEDFHHPRASAGLDGEVENWEHPDNEGACEVEEQEGQLEQEQGTQIQANSVPVEKNILQISGSSEVEPPLPEAIEAAPLPVLEVVSVPAEPSVLEPGTPLPGSFPDGTKIEVESESQSFPTEPSPRPQVRRRIRTPLEEAIARTRSPLEVALAMQLRPGLGAGADPAWMVRFLMVMWGWMFGLVLVPSAEG